MWKNYFKIASRHLWRHKTTAFINIFGLSLGISCCLLIFLYVRHETSYDASFRDAHRIARITQTLNIERKADKIAMTAMAVGPTLAKDYPEVETFVRMMRGGPKSMVSHEDKRFQIEHIYLADSHFFDVFSYEFIHGDPETALREPASVVLKEGVAQKFFGDENPVGKMLTFTRNSYKITGVVKEPETPTHQRWNTLIPISNLNFPPQARQVFMRDWFRSAFLTYAKFDSRESLDKFEGKLKPFTEKHIDPWLKENELNASIAYHVQPIRDVHLYSDHGHEPADVGNANYLYLFGVVGLFILAIACINYVNLSTAHAAQRYKEIGMRKVMGASRRQLVQQFMSEALLVSAAATVLGLGIAEALTPWYESLTHVKFGRLFFLDPVFMAGAFGTCLLVGVASGAYPALLLSRFSPTSIFKTRRSASGVGLRKALVVFQFTISAVMIVSTLIIIGQMRHLETQDLGFAQSQKLILRMPMGDTTLAQAPIAEEMQRLPGVNAAAYSNNIPGEGFGKLLQYIETNGTTEKHMMTDMYVDKGYLELMGLKVIEGRGFSPEIRSEDTAAFLVNRAAVEYMKWDNPIGVKIYNGRGFHGHIIGVVEDFHYASLHQAVEPMVIMRHPQARRFLTLDVQEAGLAETIASVERVWKKVVPKHPVEHFFLDENFKLAYYKERKLLEIFVYFSGLTILIACLGLFGLAVFAAARRTKEIGVRKTLGAAPGQLAQLLVKEHLMLTLIANLIAAPIAWFLMNRWLEAFASRTTVHPGYFIAAAAASVAIAALTVGTLAWRAASINPVRALRYE